MKYSAAWTGESSAFDSPFIPILGDSAYDVRLTPWVEDRPENMLMDLSELQRNWDEFARLDPFWAILTNPDRRGNRWDPTEFFETGRDEVVAILDQASRFGVPRRRVSALDFGCGAGRLTQAFANHVESVVGVDIAPAMIELARQHNPHGARCQYLVNDQPDLSQFPDSAFDIVYTGRVLQHMEPGYAEGYIREFVRVLAPGGYLSFDVPSTSGLFAADSNETRSLSAYRASIAVLEAPRELSPGERALVRLEVQNAGDGTWQGLQLNVGNHWAVGDSVVSQDDGRAALTQPWPPGERRLVSLEVRAPEDTGTYRLQFDVVEEGVTWFANVGSAIAEVEVDVGGTLAVTGGVHLAERASAEPQMEMHAVPRARVEELIRASAGTLLDARRVYHCGPTWLAFAYDCSK